MNVSKPLRGHAGYSLVELMVTIIVMGLVVQGIYGLHLNTQKSGQTTEVVAELQQSLRVAMEIISRDLRVAGMMIPSGDDPVMAAPDVPSGPDADGSCVNDPVSTVDACFVMQSASPNGLAARVIAVVPPSVGVPTAQMANFFENGDDVRIIRPIARTEVVANTLYTMADDPVIPTPAPTDKTVYPTLDLGLAVATEVQVGDVVVPVDAVTPTPPTRHRIAYYLRNNQIWRQVNGANDEVIAGSNVDAANEVNITTLDFQYILDGKIAPEVNAAAFDVTGNGLESIKAVRVTIGGQAFYGQGDVKSRSLQTTVRIRNR